MVDCVIVVQGVAEVFFELGEEASGYEGCRGGVDTGFALERGLMGACVVGGRGRGRGGDGGTWPPEKPTATTPSSLLEARNFGAIVEGEVIVGLVTGSRSVSRKLDERWSRKW